MLEKHLIVFGENPELQLKTHLDKMKSYKEAPWLYEGILYQEELSPDDVISIIFKDPKFAPNAIIDNKKWLVSKHFGNKQNIWREAVKQCFTMAKRDQIHFYTYYDWRS